MLKGKVIQGSFTPLLAELVAIKSGLLCAIGLGWEKFIIESDALLAIQAIDIYNPLSMEAPVVDFIPSPILCVDQVSFMHCLRNVNRVAHELTRSCSNSCQDFEFLSKISSYLQSFVNFDLQDVNVIV